MSVETEGKSQLEQAAGQQIAAYPKRVRSRKGSVANWLAPLIVFVVIMGVWYFISYVIIDPDVQFLLPPPHQIITQAFLDPEIRSELWEGLLRTFGVALTGYGMSEDVRRSHEAGFTFHLTKPIDMGQLRAAIQQVYQCTTRRPFGDDDRDGGAVTAHGFQHIEHPRCPGRVQTSRPQGPRDRGTDQRELRGVLWCSDKQGQRDVTLQHQVAALPQDLPADDAPGRHRDQF